VCLLSFAAALATVAIDRLQFGQADDTFRLPKSTTDTAVNNVFRLHKDLGFVLAMYALVIFTGIVYFERIERPLTLWLRHGVRRRGAQLG